MLYDNFIDYSNVTEHTFTSNRWSTQNITSLIFVLLLISKRVKFYED